MAFSSVVRAFDSHAGSVVAVQEVAGWRPVGGRTGLCYYTYIQNPLNIVLESVILPTHHRYVPEQRPTSFEDHAVIRDLVACLQAGAVPAVTSELVLALVDGDLDALDGGGGDVRVAHADVLLAAVQAGQRQADGVGVEDGVDVGQLQAQDLVGVHHTARG